jgi:poly(3-hydroxybutyrate) depolymerase
MKLLLSRLLVVATLSACVGQPEAPTAAQPTQLGLSFQEVVGSDTLQTSDGNEHSYFYRVPATAAPANGRPLLIWLHGDGGSGDGFGTQFYPYTDADGAVVVTPNGTGQTWVHAAGDLPGQPQDAQFLSLLIDRLLQDGIAASAIDPERVYLGGESRGAYMPYYMLMRASTRDRLAAVAVNAGIANEWGATNDPNYAEAYGRAITVLRDAGLQHTLVIDADDWGQGMPSLLAHGPTLLEADPQHNLLFSLHIYHNHFAQPESISAALGAAVQANLPFIVGEFGSTTAEAVGAIPYQVVLDEAARLQLGYLAWVWTGFGARPGSMDLSVDGSAAQLTPWGQAIIDGPAGIRSTSQAASIF